LYPANPASASRGEVGPVRTGILFIVDGLLSNGLRLGLLLGHAARAANMQVTEKRASSGTEGLAIDDRKSICG
jgi:hypothetical protein